MLIEFSKYQGTGNDFILINNFDGKFDKSNLELIRAMCDRKFGIGADGLMVLEKINEGDFELTFFNPDASLSFCGNGSRCAVRFAKDLNLVAQSSIRFKAFDGWHNAIIHGNGITISMRDVSTVEPLTDGVFINTGAPHVVIEKKDLNAIDLIQEGRTIRYDKKYNPVGTNVNFIQSTENGIKVRTYEKGVEDETLSCGTGVTASALAYALKHPELSAVEVETLGGKLNVVFSRKEGVFTDVQLSGPAELVFKGEYYAKLPS